MKIKDKTVILTGLQLEMSLVQIEAEKIWYQHEQECIITSGLDRFHSPGSLHPYGYALDLRARYFSEETRLVVASELQEALNKCSIFYDVVVHNNHIHAEYDIFKGGYTIK